MVLTLQAQQKQQWLCPDIVVPPRTCRLDWIGGECGVLCVGCVVGWFQRVFPLTYQINT
jgi:hypothetical protein